MRAHADRGGLAEDEINQMADVVRFAEHGDEQARAIFFHLHGRREYVEGAGFECALGEIAVDLRAHVVDVSFDYGDGRVPVFAWFCACGFADQDAQDVGFFGQVGGAGAVADGFQSHFWNFGVARGERGGDCCACWGNEFFGDAAGEHRRALQQLGGGGRWDWEQAMRGFHLACAYVECRTRKLVNSQQLEADCRAYDVHDRIYRAHFVKM